MNDSFWCLAPNKSLCVEFSVCREQFWSLKTFGVLRLNSCSNERLYVEFLRSALYSCTPRFVSTVLILDVFYPKDYVVKLLPMWRVPLSSSIRNGALHYLVVRTQMHSGGRRGSGAPREILPPSCLTPNRTDSKSRRLLYL